MTPVVTNYALRGATDEERMFSFFSAHTALFAGLRSELLGVRVLRALPRGDSSFTVQYELKLQVPGEETPRTVPAGGFLYTPGAAERSRSGSLRHPSLPLDLFIFPDDPRLRGIRDMLDARKVWPMLRRCIPTAFAAGGSQTGITSRVLGYRVGKRCVLGHQVLVDNDNPIRLVSKLMRRRALKATQLAARVLSSESGAIPRPLLLDADLGVYVMEYAGDRSLCDLIEEEAVVEAHRSAARALHEIHSVNPPGDLPAYGVADETVLLDRWADVLCAVAPRVGDDYRDAVAAISAAAPTVDAAPRGCIHRDFYDKQVIVSGGVARVIDYDSLSAGDPEQDKGNFLAHITLRQLQHPRAIALLHRAREAFEDEYEPEERAIWWRSATLCRLAALYALRPRWAHLYDDLLQRAMTGLERRETS